MRLLIKFYKQTNYVIIIKYYYYYILKKCVPHFTRSIYYSSSVPTGAPENVRATTITATAISVCFDPPTGSSQNGIITSFNVTSTGSTFQTTQLVTTVPVSPLEYPLNMTVCTNLSNLEENNNYTISVVSINSDGAGPTTTIIVLTLKAGEYF